MSTSLTSFFRMAVDNIAAWGDTDVFPLPPENHTFFDLPEKVVALLEDLHGDFESWRDSYGPINESALAMVGYTAFRWVTQLDPLWNAYLLGLVLSLAERIEEARISVDQEVVFSYRYEYDSSDHRLFADGGWRAFNERSLDLASSHPYVLVCDIADFYARIYHHRLENSLLLLNAGQAVPHRIDRVLNLFSNGTSYGLPVGGPAARLLAELLLNRVDRLLLTHGVTFCRFADDYHIFVESREGAYDALRFLTEKLLQNEGLTLQRAKTRIVSSRDFRVSSDFAPAPKNEPEDDDPDVLAADVNHGEPGPAEAEHLAQRSFLALSLRYDPYSPTAREDYAALREQVERFDILGMLARELSKSRIHTALTRRLIQAVRYLEEDALEGAVRTLIDNMDTLSPVLPNVLRAITEIYDDLSVGTRQYVADAVRTMLDEQRYYATVPVNLGYAVRLLGRDPSEENQALLAQTFDIAPHFVQRDIVLIMARWRAAYWLSDQRNQFSRMHAWVQRAFVMASHVLEDEGAHWRRRIGGQLSPLDGLVNDWVRARRQTPGWEIPL
jgi:Reverse transcriptase (RNA-dependent DNA polymerase)